jgi:hypothetical protein
MMKSTILKQNPFLFKLLFLYFSFLIQEDCFNFIIIYIIEYIFKFFNEIFGKFMNLSIEILPILQNILILNERLRN